MARLERGEVGVRVGVRVRVRGRGRVGVRVRARARVRVRVRVRVGIRVRACLERGEGDAQLCEERRRVCVLPACRLVRVRARVRARARVRVRRVGLARAVSWLPARPQRAILTIWLYLLWLAACETIVSSSTCCRAYRLVVSD